MYKVLRKGGEKKVSNVEGGGKAPRTREKKSSFPLACPVGKRRKSRRKRNFYEGGGKEGKRENSFISVQERKGHLFAFT